LQIKQITQEDSDKTYQFLVKMFQTSYMHLSRMADFELFSDAQFEQSGNKEYLMAILDDPKHYNTFAALDDSDNVIGTIGIKNNYGTVEMHLLYVDPSHRGSGIATKLWDYAQESIPVGSPVVLDVFESNTHAREIYEHWGFVSNLGQEYTFRWDSWPEHINLTMVRYQK
jgi:ribosomal protein S18 acetylase RimI-like enzyme